MLVRGRYMVDKEHDGPLASMDVKEFILNVGARSPTPGGGSVAALTAALVSDCYSAPDRGAERSIVMSVSVCLLSSRTRIYNHPGYPAYAFVYMFLSQSFTLRKLFFVCPRSYLRNYTSDLHQIFVQVTYGRGSVLLWRRSNTVIRYILPVLLLCPRRGVEYCDESVCLCVCLCVCLSAIINQSINQSCFLEWSK